MARHTVSVETPHARREVCADLSDFSSSQESDPGIHEADRLDHGPVRTGSRFHDVAGFLGRSAELTCEIVEHRPDDLLTLRGENASVISLDTMRFGATPAGGTRVTFEAEAPRRGSR